MEPVKPSLELLRGLTDEHVLSALMRQHRMTRAELATETGLSKPTTGESVRRLSESGIVVDTGERSAGGRGRGRVASYYALAADTGVALALSIAPEGIVAECVDAYGDVVARAEQKVERPARPQAAATAVSRALVGVRRQVTQPIRLAVVSAAGPVDRTTDRLIEVPDQAFLLGELDPAELLAADVAGPIAVDNDVNWAARAERDNAPELRDFAYVFLGEGLGCAIVSDRQVRQGYAGMAGEISHLITTGPDGSATRLIEVFAQLGLRQPDSTAIDVDRLLSRIRADEPAGSELRRALGDAVRGTLAAIVALTDPETVIVGGPWGSDPVVLEAIVDAASDLPRPVPVRAAALTAEPALTGARSEALQQLRAAIIAGATPTST
ncbi:ROK family transcriptional regulator [Kribbella sp. NPDC000426]|uniref:ROK family transcriptional regulator n=1 Tax=Kribbella sp. NPDC000426 TaxID=3154255 RepID=UPI00331DEBC6